MFNLRKNFCGRIEITIDVVISDVLSKQIFNNLQHHTYLYTLNNYYFKNRIMHRNEKLISPIHKKRVRYEYYCNIKGFLL